MTVHDSKSGDGPAEKTVQPKKGIGLSPIQVISGGAAAAVASVVGGHLGLAGTVVGAFFVSIVSGIALPLFRTSLEKSHEQIQRVVPRRGVESARTNQPPKATGASGPVRATSSKVTATQLPLIQPQDGMDDARDRSGKSGTGRPKMWMALGGTATVFVIGVGSILGIQAVIGVPLSHGTSVLQSGISQAVANVKDSTGLLPATDPKLGIPASDPSVVPAAPATETADQPPANPTPIPSTDPTTPPAADTPDPLDMAIPAAGTSDSDNGAPEDDSPAQPDTGASGGDAPAP